MAEQAKTVKARNVGGIRIRLLNTCLIIITVIVAFVFLQGTNQTNQTFKEFTKAADGYIACESAASSMKEGSNYLTAQIRLFVATHNTEYLDNYFKEARENKRRDTAVEKLEEYAKNTTAYSYLKKSRELSEILMEEEYYAAKLVIEATGGNAGIGSDVVDAVLLSEADKKLSADEKLDKAMELVFGNEYQSSVGAIERNVALCKEKLVESLQEEKEASAKELDRLMNTQTVLTWALLVVSVLMILSVIVLILSPISEYVTRIGQNKSLPMVGARELRIMADEYNVLYEENLKHNDALRRKAEHDHLTGLYNREVFERLLNAHLGGPIALLLIDADYFKSVNDTYGHDEGDRILKKLAGLLALARSWRML